MFSCEFGGEFVGALIGALFRRFAADSPASLARKAGIVCFRTSLRIMPVRFELYRQGDH